MIEQLVNLFYNYLGLRWVGRYLNSCHILPSFPSFSVVYLSLLFVMAVFLLFSVLITLTANSQLLNKWNIFLSFHPWVSTSSRQQESAILAITKETMRMEFSSFSFSGNIEQKSEESPLTLGCQTDHWNRLSQATGLTEGGRSLRSWDSSQHCCWGPQLFPSGSCHSPRCWEAGCESPCLRGVPAWTPFQSGEIALLPLQSSHSPSLPSQRWFFQEPYLLAKQAWESNHLRAISAVMDHRLL